jgi:hypothetical protein
MLQMNLAEIFSVFLWLSLSGVCGSLRWKEEMAFVEMIFRIFDFGLWDMREGQRGG